MSVIWTAPLALIGLALVALPIAVHLLARHEVRTLPFPSLRFLRETQLAAFRRRSIQDVLLLICRVATVGAAAAALAGPIFETSSRSASDAKRVSRAVIATATLPSDVSARVIGDAFRSVTLRRSAVADALGDAVRWLEQQPRSSREIVVAGPLRRGDVGPGDLAMIPAAIGVRFEQTAIDGSSGATVSILIRRDGVLSRIDRAATLTADGTRVVDGAATPALASLVTVVAAPRDAVLADAALRAALNAGVPWHDFAKRVVVMWEGADERSLQSTDARVIRMPVPTPSSSAAGAVHAELAKAGGAGLIEPLTIPRPQLDAWSRPAGAPSADAPIADEGDRRWLWAAALVLLCIEWWLRRPPSRSSRFGGQAAPGLDTRVA